MSYTTPSKKKWIFLNNGHHPSHSFIICLVQTMVLMIAGASLNQHKPVSSSEDFARTTMLDMNENKRYKLCGSILNHLDNGVHWGSKKFRALYFVYQVKTIWGHLYFLQTCTPNEEIQSLVLMVYAHVPEHHSLLPALSPWWSWAVTPNQLSWLGKSHSINFHQHNTFRWRRPFQDWRRSLLPVGNRWADIMKSNKHNTCFDFASDTMRKCLTIASVVSVPPN